MYTRSSNNEDRTEDVAVPITFTPPPTTITTTTTPSTTTTTTTTSSSTTTTTTPTTPTTPTTTTTEGPTTSTIGGSATTVSPNSMLQTSVVAGGNQVVVFTGFTPGEGVAVTLFSDPISLPPVTADNSGTVRVEFAVPADLPPGVHILQAIGAQSRRVGDRAVRRDRGHHECVQHPTTSSPRAHEFLAEFDGVDQFGVVERGDHHLESQSDRHARRPRRSPRPAAPPRNNLLWLWITLGVVVLVGAAAGIVAMIRARNHEDDDLPPLVVAGAPAPPPPGWSGGRAAPPPLDDPAVGERATSVCCRDKSTSCCPGGAVRTPRPR